MPRFHIYLGVLRITFGNLLSTLPSRPRLGRQRRTWRRPASCAYAELARLLRRTSENPARGQIVTREAVWMLLPSALGRSENVAIQPARAASLGKPTNQ